MKTAETLEPTIAVVIPLFNKAAFIEATLASVLEQTHAPTEIIIVDDGSSDDGLALAKALAGDRLTIFTTPKAGSGPSAARNLGAQKARSEWIALLDADDLWMPDYLDSVARGLGKSPPVDFVFSNWIVKDLSRGSKKAIPDADKFDGRALDFDGFLQFWVSYRYCPMWTSASVIRRETLLGVGGFPEDYRRGEDKDTWIRVASSGTGLYLSEARAYYTVGVPDQEHSKKFKMSVPPGVLTAQKLIRSGDFSKKTTGLLKDLINLLIWQYCRVSKLRSVVPAEFSKLFYFDRDPLRYGAVKIITLLSDCVRLVRRA